MSFVSKAASKIFKGAKKVGKAIGKAFDNKWVRYVALAALAVFATGLGSTGFDGFKTAMETGGGGLGGFFSAVGSTMSTGFSTIYAGGSKFFTGSATGAAPTIAPEYLEGGAEFVGPSSELATNYVTQAAAERTGKSVASNMIQGLFGNTSGGSIARNAIMTGIAFSQSRNGGGGGGGYPGAIRARANIYGGRARKGTPEVPEGLIRSPFENVNKTPEPLRDERRYVTNKTRQPSATIAQPLLGGATQIASLPGAAPLLGEGVA